MEMNNQKKGLIVYDSVYGSTVEVAYWIKSIIGMEQCLDVKPLTQVITVEPYDYVIIGSATRMEKPLKGIYSFVKTHKQQLANRQVCYFLLCGDCDETMVLNIPGKPPHLIAGRNYLQDIQKKYPEIRPVAIGAFGGRQVMPRLQKKEALTLWLLEKLAKEGTPWKGLDIWESLIAERVEVFANEVRGKILGASPNTGIERFRGYWQALQPGSLTDGTKKKYTPKPYFAHEEMARQYFTRSRIHGDMELGIQLLKQWATACGLELKEQSRTFFNVYYHAVKIYRGRSLTIHIVAAAMPEDPGNLHVSFRCYAKKAVRGGAEIDIAAAEEILWAEGRKAVPETAR